MPEGHHLHGLAGRLTRAFAGRPVAASSPQGRFADGAALLDGRVLREVSAWGKHLFAEFEADTWLNVHLGLIGRWDVDRVEGDITPWGQVRLRLRNDRYVADLRGATLCAVVTPEEVQATRARLGPDPLRPGADPERAWQKLSRSGRPVGELLADQAVVAGIGNVYRCELLFRARVDPFRPGREIRPSTWHRIWDDVVELMPLGVAASRILTMQDQVEEALAQLADTGKVDLPDHRFYVYRRTGEPCRVCGSKIRSQVMGGRNLFWCGRCQRRR
ncbi:MAG TPA: DNA-formamidopyrimidine glycosylase family protein [Dermatophilaceae bacterium]|nr:DNA-formamidopyrimidine glycosylase family protein [Dermatophilaceae bacterium]